MNPFYTTGSNYEIELQRFTNPSKIKCCRVSNCFKGFHYTLHKIYENKGFH